MPDLKLYRFIDDLYLIKRNDTFLQIIFNNEIKFDFDQLF